MSLDHDTYPDEYLRAILTETRVIAVVGASANPKRASHGVLKYLLSKGYDAVPINPGHAGREIAGAACYKSLAELSIEKPIDMVDIFRNSDAVAGVVEEVLSLSTLPEVIWMQLDIRNDEAAKRAEAKGVKVVMNRCPKIEYPRLFGTAHLSELVPQ